MLSWNLLLQNKEERITPPSTFQVRSKSLRLSFPRRPCLSAYYIPSCPLGSAPRFRFVPPPSLASSPLYSIRIFLHGGFFSCSLYTILVFGQCLALRFFVAPHPCYAATIFFLYLYPHRRRKETVFVCVSAGPRDGRLCPVPIPPDRQRQLPRTRAKVLNVETSCVEQFLRQTFERHGCVLGCVPCTLLQNSDHHSRE